MPRPRNAGYPPAGGTAEPCPEGNAEPLHDVAGRGALGGAPGGLGSPGDLHQPSPPSGVLTNESDEVLAARACQGDDRAYEELVGRYERVIFNLTFRMTGNREDARELTQETFVRAWRGLGGFDRGRRFFSWIYRIAVHGCLNHRRRSVRSVELVEELQTNDVGPEGRMEAREAEERIRTALDRLPNGDKELLVLRHFLDRSLEEIAGILGVPAKRVKSRLFSARQRLRAELERMGVGP